MSIAISFDLMVVIDKTLNKFVDKEERRKNAAHFIVNPKGWFYEWLKGNVDLEILIGRKNWWLDLWEVHNHKPRSSFFERLLTGHHQQVMILLDLEIILAKQLIIQPNWKERKFNSRGSLIVGMPCGEEMFDIFILQHWK